MSDYLVEFPETKYPSVRLEEGAELSCELDAVNSPLLFGCRSGLCGTCLVEIEPNGETLLDVPAPEEREALEVYAPGNERARLACQIRLSCGIRVKKIESA